LNRREFLLSLGGLAGCYGISCLGRAAWAERTPPQQGLVEVAFYKRLEGGRIECGICPRRCRVGNLERGYCGNKENRHGRYYTLVHSRPCAVHADPIEKKPFFHVLPGTLAFSIATAGCNIECLFCQNWQISQFRPEQVSSIHLPPREVVRRAKELGCHTIAYTYSEPVVFYDYMFDTAVEGRKEGVESVMVTNGYINEKPLRSLCEHLLAVKVDLKAFTKRFYKELCHGELEPVKQTLVRLLKWGMWTEIVVLILPTNNDSPSEIREMSRWIHEALSPDIPVHFSRFFPTYKIRNLPPTPVDTLERCRNIAMDEGLNFVYIGNVPGHPAEKTYCPNCNSTVINRIGYRIISIDLDDGKCSNCKHEIPGIWSKRHRWSV
jgi:pyruvate formate lyase activating enzyme